MTDLYRLPSCNPGSSSMPCISVWLLCPNGGQPRLNIVALQTCFLINRASHYASPCCIRFYIRLISGLSLNRFMVLISVIHARRAAATPPLNPGRSTSTRVYPTVFYLPPLNGLPKQANHFLAILEPIGEERFYQQNPGT